jgi:hypothetical protein
VQAELDNVLEMARGIAIIEADQEVQRSGTSGTRSCATQVTICRLLHPPVLREITTNPATFVTPAIRRLAT